MVQNPTPEYPAGAFMAYWTPNGDPTPELEDPNALLEGIREKILSIFGDEAILSRQVLPQYHLQRGLGRRQYKSWALIPGNDFHAIDYPSATVDPKAWSAKLQLPASYPQMLELSLNHFWQTNASEDTIVRAASEIRKLWPDAYTRGPKRRLSGLLFHCANATGYKIMAWLGSLDLNAESVDLKVLPKPMGFNEFVTTSEKSQTLLSKPSPAEDIESYLEVSKCECEDHPVEKGKVHRVPTGDLQVAHVWSFTSEKKPWVISIPAMAAILSLMSHPEKPLSQQGEVTCRDSDLSWCLDSLHSFCREESPSYAGRDLSFSLGTYDDCWMYLSCILTYYEVKEMLNSPYPPNSQFYGLACARKTHDVFSVGTFSEGRILVAARVAAGHINESASPFHAAVGVILTDMSHQPLHATYRDYLDRDLNTRAHEISGVSLFVNLVWTHLDLWHNKWTQCLDHVADRVRVKFDHLKSGHDIEDRYPIFNPREAVVKYHELIAAIELLGVFQEEIAEGPKTLERMKKEWMKTYKKGGGRFEGIPLEWTMANWEKLAARAGCLHSELLKQIDGIQKEIRIRQTHVFELGMLTK